MFPNKDYIQVLDLMLQGRISQQYAYWNRYDITFWGQHIYEGTGTGEFWNLDNAYMDMIIQEGILFTFLWTISTMIVISYFYKRHRITEVAILVMYVVYGISETFLPNCFLNISLFLYGEVLYDKLDDKSVVQKKLV
jgi:hypothetical protein